MMRYNSTRSRFSSFSRPGGGGGGDRDREDTHSVAITPKYSNRNNEADDSYDDAASYEEDDETTEASATVINTSRRARNNVIALFGVESKTGTQFVRLALDAGYTVQAMRLSQSQQQTGTSHEKIENREPTTDDFTTMEGSPGIEWIHADHLYDVEAIQLVLSNATYVVCLFDQNQHHATAAMNSSAPNNNHNDNDTVSAMTSLPATTTAAEAGEVTKQQQHVGPLSKFVQLLYPIMMEVRNVRVFLYQATSLCTDTKGQTPILSRVFKTASNVTGGIAHYLLPNGPNRPMVQFKCHLKDLDFVITNIIGKYHKKKHAQNHARFNFIVTRPATNLLKDGPSSTKKVSASKSQPGPFPISYIDLAEFTLNALLTKKLYNTCPYVVADSF